jgi:pimeloyl-ACP methyl ester carboxylesterase
MSMRGYTGDVSSVSRVDLPDGVSLHVEEHGDPAAELTVVFLHGWTLDARLWGAQVRSVPRLLDGAVRTLAFDFRGHGRSTACARHATTLEWLADDLAAVLRERVRHGRIVLVGHSMGGMTIMQYAERHPDEFAARVAGVVLIATSAEGTAHTTYGLGPALARLFRRMEQTGASVLARSGPWRPHRSVMPVLLPGVRWFGFGDTADPDDVRLTADMIGSASLGAIGGFRPWIDAQNLVEALVRMRTLPAAVLVGSRDRLTPQPCAETIAAALPNAERVICPEAGHMLPLERPHVVSDAIARVCRQAIGRTPVRTGVRSRITALRQHVRHHIRQRPATAGS